MKYNELREAIINISKNNYHYLFTIQNVVGVGFGTKRINGINTSKPCIHILVDKKVDRQYLSYGNFIPKTYMGIDTDVIEVGTFYACGLTSKIRPLQGGYGVSVDGAIKNTGSIGCVVTKGNFLTRKYYILSNNHVLAGYNEFKLGSKVVQPAAADGGICPNDYIGILADYIILKFQDGISSPINYMDAAIAQINSKSLVSNLIAKVGLIKGFSDPVENQKIKMVGSTTGLSKGIIVTVGATTRDVTYSNGKKASFKNQVIAALKNAGGDSGSIILNELNQALGLFFAGTDSKTAMFSNIKSVLKALQVEIYT